MYLIALMLAFCIAYVALFFFFPFFFGQTLTNARKISLRSLSAILIGFLVTYGVSAVVSDVEWSNRILHALCGGFFAFFVCFLAARDSGVGMRRFQFFVLSALIVTALGVANEIAEYALQAVTHLSFALTLWDTWLDLVSNTVGILVGATLFVPLFGKK